jgi:hypothetical protein
MSKTIRRATVTEAELPMSVGRKALAADGGGSLLLTMCVRNRFEVLDLMPGRVRRSERGAQVRIVDAIELRDGGTVCVSLDLGASTTHLTLPAALLCEAEPRYMVCSDRQFGCDRRLEPGGDEERAWVESVRVLAQEDLPKVMRESGEYDPRPYVEAFLAIVDHCPLRRERLGLPPRRAHVLKHQLAWTPDNIALIASAYLEEAGEIPAAVVYEFLNVCDDDANAAAIRALIERITAEHRAR